MKKTGIILFAAIVAFAITAGGLGVLYANFFNNCCPAFVPVAIFFAIITGAINSFSAGVVAYSLTSNTDYDYYY